MKTNNIYYSLQLIQHFIINVLPQMPDIFRNISNYLYKSVSRQTGHLLKQANTKHVTDRLTTEMSQFSQPCDTKTLFSRSKLSINSLNLLLLAQILKIHSNGDLKAEVCVHLTFRYLFNFHFQSFLKLLLRWSQKRLYT